MSTASEVLNPQAIANLLWAAQSSGKPCVPIRELLGDGGADLAYAVQEINSKRRLANGSRLVGRKIGLTSLAVQKQLGVDEPDYGMLFADMIVRDGEQVLLSKLIQPKVEAEIAFVLGCDLEMLLPTAEDLIHAIDFAVAAIEIVDSRIHNWDIRLVDTIADNASGAMYVLGTQQKLISDIDLVNCSMVMQCRGETVSTGKGEECLGNPLNAAIWLATTMARVGRPLRAGDVILSGALGPMVQVKSGDTFEACVSGLGSVSVAFI